MKKIWLIHRLPLIFQTITVGGQNSSSQFISRVGTASSGFGVVGGKKGKMTQDLPWFGQWGLRPPSLFLLIIGHPLQ